MNAYDLSAKPMNTYRVRFISGPQEALCSRHEHYVTAPSSAAALAMLCSWPVQHNMEQTCAWATNPGTSLYDVEAWEAECCPPGLAGDFVQSGHHN